jgi:FkbM family methyltransferase
MLRSFVFKLKFLLIRYLPPQIKDALFVFWRYLFFLYSNTLTIANKKPYSKTLIFEGLYVRFLVNNSLSWVSREIDILGLHEENILGVIIANLNEGDTFIDVGANIGQHSLFAAKKVGLSGKVFAIEPIEKLCDNIKQSATLNKFQNLSIINKAVGDSSKLVDFYEYDNTEISGKNNNFNDFKYSKIHIEQDSLDVLLRDSSRVDLIKIDVEGFEFDVLVGASEILKKYHPKIIMEFSTKFYDQKDSNLSNKILEFLKNNDYTIDDVDNLFVRVDDITAYVEALRKSTGISNILCT